MTALTISSNIISAADITQDAPESAGTGDDLTLNAGVVVASSGGNVTLAAGDDVLIHGTASASGKTLSVMAGSSDADGRGAITIDGAASAANTNLAARSGIIIAGRLTATSTLDLTTGGGGVSETGAARVMAGRLQSHGGIVGDVDLTGAANTIAALGDFSVTHGALNLNDTAATLTINGPVSADDVRITSSGTIVHALSSVKQILAVSGNNGFFTLAWNGGTTPLLSPGVSADALQDALNALPGAGGAIAVSGSAGVFTITFGGAFVGNAPPLITAMGGPGISAGITAGGDSTVAGHTVTLIADQMALDAGVITASDTITLAPLTSGTAVSLGDGVAATFALGAAELATLAAPTVTIGKDTTATITAGAIQIGTAAVASSALNLFAQGGVTMSTGTFSVGGGTGTLTIKAGGPVTLGGAALLVLDVASVGGATTSGAFGVATTSTNTLTGAAITTQGGEITLRNAAGGVTVDGALASHGGHIMAGTRASGANTTVNADIDAGSGSIVLVATAGSVTQTTGRLVGANLLALSAPGLDITLDSTDNAITDRVAFVGHNVSFTNSHAFTIGYASVLFTSTGAFIAPPTGAAVNANGMLALTTGGDITQGQTLNDSIIAGALTLARLGGANPDVTFDNVNNKIATLGSVAIGDGALTLTNAIDLALTSAVAAGSLTLTTPGTLTFGGGTVTTSGDQAYHAAAKLGAATTLMSAGGTIGFDHALDNSGFDLTVNVAVASLFANVISGSGRFIKEGSGTVTLGANDIYAGATLVNAGTLIVDGSIASGLTTIAGGATLGGHGTLGTLVVHSGGILAPGDSLGVLATGDALLFAGAHLDVEIGGTAAGSYDQLAVHGAVSLDGATLDGVLLSGFAPAAGESFTILDNDGTDAVNGTFAGLAEGAHVNIGGSVLSISYHGGDGNDVTLTTLANHAPVNTVPGAQSVTAGDDLAIAGLAVADQDADAGTIATTLAVTHGTLHLSAGHAALAGNDSASVTLTGTLAEIDATLAANVTYRAQAGFTGGDTLTIITSDNGNSGLGGPLTDTDTVKIDVSAPLHLPPVPVVGTDGDDNFIAPGGDSIFVGRSGLDGISFGFKLTDATISYSGNQIIIDGPNGSSHTVVNGIEVFNFSDGTVNTRDGDPLVDDLFYYAHNHDVWNAHLDADTHFDQYGWKEGRDPNAWFDTKGYLAAYSDVAAAGINPLTHYDQNGWHEGRDPSASFDTGDYLAHNADVAAAHIDPLAHFLAWGSEEGRLP